MTMLRRNGAVLVLCLWSAGCDLLGGSQEPAALVVSVTGLPADMAAGWEVTLLDGRPVSKGTVAEGASDTVEVDGSERYFVRFSPFSGTVNGVDYYWVVPEPIVRVGPLGGGGGGETVGAYTQVAGALRLRATVGWEAQVRATITPVPPTPGAPRTTGFFSAGGEKLFAPLVLGSYEVRWDPIQRPMGTAGRFGNTWSHMYRAEPDTVLVAPLPVPSLDSVTYALTSGAFRVSFTGLPAGLLVGGGLRRTDGAVAIGGTFSTTPGLESVIVTEWLGNYTYSSVDVSSGGVTYRAVPSPVFTLSAALIPVEVVIAYAPLP